MSKLFLADPFILKQEGNKLKDESKHFEQNVSKVYSTIQEMLSSAYVSPAAKALGVKIMSYKDDLDAMTKIIDDYGMYCIMASNKVSKNEQNIIDTFTTNTNPNENE